MGLKVDTRHRDYEANLPIWNKVDDAADGQEAIKAGGTKYLPQPNPSDTSDDNKARYAQYKERANYVNFTGRTLSGLVGMVFGKEAVTKFPSGIEELIEDIDGSGISLMQQSKRSLSRTIKQGRAGLFVDFPESEGEIKKDQVDSGLMRPVCIAYPASKIINWRSERIGSIDKLILIVLQESREVIDPEDPFVSEDEIIYRVLSLEEGVYVQRVFVKAESDKDGNEWEQESETIPTKGEGNQTFDTIPFTFIGSINNDADPDKSALLDLANVNIAHYRNSADLEESSYVAGQPTPHVDMGEMDEAEWTTANPQGMRFGVLGGIRTRGGSVTLIQAEANSMPREGMQDKEKQMGALGAKMVEPQQAAITATEATNNNVSETSVLSTIVKNVSEAYELALFWMTEFSRAASGEIEFQLNSDFNISKLDSQELLAVIQGWQAGLISKKDAHDYTVAVGLSDSDFEESEQDIEDNPPGLNLPVQTALNLSEGGSNNE